MLISNDIVLRPRFKIEIPRGNASILQTFEQRKTSQSDYIVSRVDDHVFIKFPREKRHFWSPQLHLEINEIDKDSSLLYGLFGPNPTVWTLFMFLHFVVAVLCLAFGIWAYTNWTLNNGFAIQLSLMLLMVVLWFALYFIGRIGRDSSKDDMLQLKNFMIETLNQ